MDNRMNKYGYPARGFLNRFLDAAVQKLVKGFYPNTDFSETSGDMIDISLLRRIELRGAQDLAGLEIFACAEELHLYDSIFINNVRILHSYMNLKIICIKDCVVGSTLFPEHMAELSGIQFTRCRYISTVKGTEDGFLCLPEQAPKLKIISITDTVRNCDRRQKLILPREMDEIEQIDLSAGDFMPFIFRNDMLPRLKFLDMRGNEFRRLLYLPRTPALKELRIALSPDRADMLEELAVIYAPGLLRLVVQNHAYLRAIQLPGVVNEHLEIETENCETWERR